MPGGKAEELSAAVDRVGKRLSTATILFHAAVAARIGLGPTDAKCSTLLAAGPVTAGELASMTGLTTGAITGVIDRLEAAGIARRIVDPSDRRRVIVERVPDLRRDRELELLFAPMAKAIRQLVSRYTPSELETISKFLNEASEILERETYRLQRRE